jgi:hypothetical protein
MKTNCVFLCLLGVLATYPMLYFCESPYSRGQPVPFIGLS